MAEVIDTLIAVIGSDIKGFSQGIQRVNSEMDSLAGRITRGGVNVAALGGIVTAATAPIAGALGASAKSAMDFETEMKNISAVTGTTGADLTKMEQQIRAIGTASRYGPEEAARTFYDIAGSVTDTTVRMDLLEASIKTAQAGNADLTGTTRALVSVMNAYNLKAKDAAIVSDILTRTVGMGVGTMDQFAAALPKVTGVANSLGVSFADLSAMTAFLTTKGYTASQATTQLSAMMTALIKPNKDMKAALKALGFETGQAAIKQLGLLGTYEAFVKAGFENKIGKLTGRAEALRGVTALTGKEAGAFLKTFKTGIKGATSEAEKIQLGSTAAQMDLLKSQAQDLGITIGQVLLPPINQLIAQIMPVVQGFGKWAAENPALLQQLVMFGVALVTIGPAIGIVGAAITGIGAVLGILMGPVGIVIAGIVALAAAFQTNFLGIRDAVMGVVEFVRPYVENLGRIFTEFFNTMTKPGNMDFMERLRTAITTAIPKIRDTITEFVGDLAQHIGELGEKFVEGFQLLLGHVGEWLATGGPGKLAEGLAGLISGMVNWLTTTAVPTVVGGFRKLWEGVVAFFQSEGVQAFIIGMGKWLSDTYKWLTDTAMPSMVDAMVQGILGFFKWLASDGSVQFQSGVRNWFTEAINWVGTVALPGLIKMIEDFIKEVARLGSKIVETLANSVSQGLTGKVGDVQIDPMKGSVSVQGGAGELLGSIMNAIWGGGKAGGGPVSAGMNYLVGERGPEILSMGSKPGFITPNGMMGGGGGYNGPQSVEVVLEADGFEERIVLKLAQAQRAGKLKAQAT